MARKAHRRIHKIHRRVRRARRNPAKKIRKARVKIAGATVVIPTTSSAKDVAASARASHASRPRRKYRRLSKKQRSVVKRLRSSARRIRKSAKKMPTATSTQRKRRRAKLVQARRMTALAALAPRKPKSSPLARALTIKTNPGLAGLANAAKVILPQAAAGAVAMVGLAMAGNKLGQMAKEKGVLAADSKVAPYASAIATTLLTAGGYLLADKFAPKFKGAVAIGGILGAVLQAVNAASMGSANPDSLTSKAKAALLGDYTTVGSRAYAEGGVFREIGDYTTVGVGGWSEARDGGAYSNTRPRNTADNRSEWATPGIGSLDSSIAARNALVARSGGAYSNTRPRSWDTDNATEWARDSLHGLDDTTEFAPGEGGILSGGLFRGPSTR